MNRLYLILAATVVMSAIVVVDRKQFRIGSIPGNTLAVLLGLMCAWSAREVSKFRTMSQTGRRAADTEATLLLPENVLITRFSYLVFPQLPGYFSHGVVDPELEQRFYSPDGKLQWSNSSLILDAVAAKDPRARLINYGTFNPSAPDQSIWTLGERLKLAPGQRYLLRVNFGQQDPAGVLQLKGKRMFREYELPLYGEPKSFGVGPEAQKTLAVWSSEAGGDEVELNFYPRSLESATAQAMMTVDLIQYDRALLRAKVLSWIPYRVTVDSDTPGRLETPRSYQPYWTATDGPARVKRSPDALVMLEHPGKGQIRGLSYKVPIGFTLLFWTASLTAVGSFFLLALTSRPLNRLCSP